MDDGEAVSAKTVPYALAALGVLSGASIGVETVVRLTADPVLNLQYVAGVVSSLPFAVLLVVGPFRILDDDLAPERYRRLGGWALVSGASLVTLFTIIALPTYPSFWNRVGVIRWAVAVGTGGGLLVGIFEARAIERAVATERATVRARELERRKELLDYLNGVLRHEVLNTAQVIEGYADLIEDSERDTHSPEEAATVIRQEARELRSVTQDVKVLLQSAEEPDEMVPVDLGAVVRAELDEVQRQHPELTVETDVPDDVHVRGDGLLRRVFRTLFDNAVEHNDSETPRVSVSVTTADGTATVAVEDNGPGIPEEKRKDLFEYTVNDGPGHDLGLAIVATLAERYDGSVELARTGSDGSRFTVELPRSQAPNSGETEREAPSVEQ